MPTTSDDSLFATARAFGAKTVTDNFFTDYYREIKMEPLTIIIP